MYLANTIVIGEKRFNGKEIEYIYIYSFAAVTLQHKSSLGISDFLLAVWLLSKLPQEKATGKEGCSWLPISGNIPCRKSSNFLPALSPSLPCIHMGISGNQSNH